MPGLTRRQLCAGTAVAGAVWGLGCDAGAGRDQSASGYGALVGTRFQVMGGADRGQTRVLAAVLAHTPPVRAPRPRGESFVLEFEAEGMSRAQGTRSLQHPALGSFDLFLVPRRGPGPSGRPRFAATFCRL